MAFLPWIVGPLAGFFIGWVTASNYLVVTSARLASEIMYGQIGEWHELLVAASTSDTRHKDEKIALLLDLIGRELGKTE